MLNKVIKKAVALGLLIGAPLVQADDFTGFSMNFVDIGNTTNVDDNTGYGAVGYNYRMGVNEVSETMIDSYNAANPTVQITQDNRGDDRPATSVSWNEAARFVNWLNTSQGYQAAYNVSGAATENISLWGSADAWQTGGENLFRHKDAHYFLPSEDEWYKAAYYDPDHGGVGVGGYYNYATGSDTAPTTTTGGTAAGTAVYRDGVNPNPTGPADITNAGGLSKYGTMAQNGNVWEWGESGFTAPNDSAVESRVFRGGYWYDNSGSLQSSGRNYSSPTNEDFLIGFRVAAVPVAAVPEPSGVSLLVIGAIGLMMKRRRG